MSEVLKQQVGGNHYSRLQYQPIVLAFKLNLNPAQFSMLKYLSRWENKNGLEDLKKIKHYADIQKELGSIGEIKTFYFEEIQKFVDMNGFPQKYYFIIKNILYGATEVVKEEIDRIILEVYG